MSEDKEIKFPSGSTIQFVGEDLNDVFKGLSDNPKLKASIEKTEVQKLRSSKERKVWKLKRLNVKLGQQRRAIYNQMITLSNESELFTSILIAYTLRVGYISEQIGKNSNKIQRLRTLIQQEKLSEEV